MFILFLSKLLTFFANNTGPVIDKTPIHGFLNLDNLG